MGHIRLALLLGSSVAADALSIYDDPRWGWPWNLRWARRRLARLRSAIQRAVERQRERRYPDRGAARVGPPPAAPSPAVRATGRIGRGAGRRGPGAGAA